MANSNPPNWQQKLKDVQTESSIAPGDSGYAEANAEMAGRTIRGFGPDSSKQDPRAGAHVVFNIQAAHIPAFVKASRSRSKSAYLNTYDLSTRAGTAPSKRRTTVDEALPVMDEKKVYFGAVELNGSGIRYFGDYCLVLNNSVIDDRTVVLDRNSYELMRAPLNGNNLSSAQRKQKVQEWQGNWKDDMLAMGTIRVLEDFGRRARRVTTATVSDSILHDEDYMEVLRERSFDAQDVAEVRTLASEAARESLVAQRMISGPPLRVESLIWRNRRRLAETALAQMNIPVRVVTSAGRGRS